MAKITVRTDLATVRFDDLSEGGLFVIPGDDGDEGRLKIKLNDTEFRTLWGKHNHRFSVQAPYSAVRPDTEVIHVELISADVRPLK